MSDGRTCGETVRTTAALVNLASAILLGMITQSEYDLGVAYVMGYQDAMACRPCDPTETIDKFKEADE